ncbi:MAG: 16S rRNA (cytosine(967)-C(5))-methyltransferase RsmB [Oscillospiraceae bacterium]|nr:16S rRNA (cytosine(967)-C(5))-methyltransferase RsmB [Oscillospiraceae bacterium]
MTAREAAFRAVSLYRRRGVWPETMLDSLITSEGMDPRDAALACEISGGVMRNMSLLDFYISAFLTSKISKLEPAVTDILRISAYQLIFLDRIPAHAAVSEGVELTKRRANPKAASLVNAVLRKIAANKDSLPEIPSEDPAKYLSVKYSHPAWLVSELLDTLGFDDCEAFLRENNKIPPITAQVNTLKAAAGEAIEVLAEDGVAAEPHPWLNNALIVGQTGALTSLKAFKDGLFYVQDAAARLAVTAADLKPGMSVLDGCSAPGGKSFAAAIDMENRGIITSCDLHEKKLKKIDDGADRLGISIIKTLAADGREPYAGLVAAFDCVFADVPCSGIGVIRKKPDIRYRSEKDVSALPDIQLDILRGLSKCVKPGGELIYSTCTVLSRENRGVVDRFLEENGAFALEGFTLQQPVGSCGGDVALWPQKYGTDGFYICKMRRKP